MKFELSLNHQKEKSFLLSIQNYFEASDESIHKARNEIKIIDYNGIKYVVKSFKVPHLLNKIVYTFFRASKAKKSFDNSLKIKDFTPSPFGYIEFLKGGLLDKSYYVSEAYSYDFTIREPFSDVDFLDKSMVLKLFAQFTFNLHNSGIVHQDFSPGNILIKKLDDTYEFKIVDVNRMVFSTLSMEERARNLSKLWASDENLSIIAGEYARLASFDRIDFFKKALFYSNEHKQKKEFYKRLKGE